MGYRLRDKVTASSRNIWPKISTTTVHPYLVRPEEGDGLVDGPETALEDREDLPEPQVVLGNNHGAGIGLDDGRLVFNALLKFRRNYVNKIHATKLMSDYRFDPDSGSDRSLDSDRSSGSSGGDGSGKGGSAVEGSGEVSEAGLLDR